VPFEEVVLRLAAGVLFALDLDVLGVLLRLRVFRARAFVVLDLPDEPFRLVDLLDLEPVRLGRVLEDRVV
jgi:hypothetical protein